VHDSSSIRGRNEYQCDRIEVTAIFAEQEPGQANDTNNTAERPTQIFVIV